MSETGNAETLTDNQARVLDGALDAIIPPSDDGRLPGAGELGLAHFIDALLRKTPELRAMVLQSVEALDALARRRTSHGFAALSRADRSGVLNELASSEHAFPPVLILHTYAGYYQDPRVLQALGLEPRPPHPRGYTMEPNDLSLLDPVRQRSKLYREG